MYRTPNGVDRGQQAAYRQAPKDDQGKRIPRDLVLYSSRDGGRAGVDIDSRRAGQRAVPLNRTPESIA